jgi:hypothetical protein
MLHVDRGKIVSMGEVTSDTEWAKPILAQAMKLNRS